MDADKGGCEDAPSRVREEPREKTKTPGPSSVALEEENAELRHSLQRTREALTKYVDLYDFSPVGCVTLDPDGRIRAINQTGSNILGKQRGQLMGVPFFSFVAEGDLKGFTDHMQKCANGNGKVTSEVTVGNSIRKTHLQLTSMPVPDPIENIVLYRTVMTDMSEVRMARERFDKAFHANPAAISISRLSDERFIEVNASFLDLVGFEREEVIGRSPQELGMIVNQKQHEKLLQRLARDGAIEHCGNIFRTRTGEIRRALASFEIIELDGRSCILAMRQDITEERRLEQEIVRVSDEEQARLGRELHDGLCQELAAVVFMTESLLQQLSRPNADTAHLAEAARKISDVVKRSVVETHSLASGLFPTNLLEDGLVHALGELAANVTARFGISCLFECEKMFAISDRDSAIHVYRIVQEAVNNAIKHGNAIEIAIEMNSTPEGYLLTVSDNGKGMPSELPSRGMGLRTMKYRTRLLDGTLDIGRRSPTGTVVQFSFPCSHGTGSDDRTERAARTAAEPPRRTS